MLTVNAQARVLESAALDNLFHNEVGNFKSEYNRKLWNNFKNKVGLISFLLIFVLIVYYIVAAAIIDDNYKITEDQDLFGCVTCAFFTGLLFYWSVKMIIFCVHCSQYKKLFEQYKNSDETLEFSYFSLHQQKTITTSVTWNNLLKYKGIENITCDRIKLYCYTVTVTFFAILFIILSICLPFMDPPTKVVTL
jgi:hypothetical protein